MKTILKELKVTATAVAAFLVLDLILNNQGLFAEVNCLAERCRDSMMGSLGLGYEALVSFNDGSFRVLNLPFADVAECFTADGGLLGGLGGSPPVSPVLSELLEERSLDLSGLYAAERDVLSASIARN